MSLTVKLPGNSGRPGERSPVNAKTNLRGKPHVASWSESLPWILGLSALMFGGSIVVAGVMVARMPSDYLTREKAPKSAYLNDRPVLSGILWFLKNAVGLVILIAGVVMLLAPGQGLLFIFLGLTLVDFSGKTKLLRKIIRRPGVMKTINRFRKRAGRPPLEQRVISTSGDSEDYCTGASNRQNFTTNR